MPRAGSALSTMFHLADPLIPNFLLASALPEALIIAAKARPSAAARSGLTQLLGAIEDESELSLFGRLSLRWDMRRLLQNTQMIEDAHSARPELGAAPIMAPIFILGLPRSGTTFLHELMAEDASNLVPRNWQTMYPAPRPRYFEPTRDKHVRSVDRQLRLFAGLAPGFAALHPITADSPQECSEITSHVFQSLRFDTTYRIPSYFSWLEAHGHDNAFRFHKQFLQFLQDGQPGNWVLKCPDHTFTLDSILRVYPDARFIIVHRDPLAVLGSVAHLTEVLRAPFVKNIDAGEIGAQVAARWTQGANLLLEFDRRQDVEDSRKFHLHYDELVDAPLATISRIYAQFGRRLDNNALTAMERRLNAKAHGGYARHPPYRLENFKLSASALQAGFAPYVQQYCQAQE